MKLEKEFYLNDPFEIGKALLGATLHTSIDGEKTAGKIVELEIYMGPEDKASHAFGGRRTERTEVMYHSGGTSYIYLIYGIYSMFNVVTSAEGIPHAILIRALEPVEGLDKMKARRNTNNIHQLASGPGKLCTALGLSREQNGMDLTGNTIWIERPEVPVAEEMILRASRIGIDYAAEYKDKPWRFHIKDNPHVSKK